MALVEQIPLTKSCGSQGNREALYSPFAPLQYTYFAQAMSPREISSGLRHETAFLGSHLYQK